MLILPLVKGFHHGLCSILLSGCQRIAHTSAGQSLSRFARRFAQRMAADCSFFRSSTAFTVCAPFCLADDNILLVLLLVNGFHCLRAVLFNGWQRIARSSARQRLSWFARCFAQRMTAHCSYFCSSKAFTTGCAPYCSADGSGLLIHPLINGFPDGLRALLLTRWQRLARSSARQRLLRFARQIAKRMSADCSYLPFSTAFLTVRTPYCSADGIGSLVLPLVNGFHDGLHPLFLRGWQWIAHSFSRQRLSRFARRIAHRMAADWSYFRLSMAFPTFRVSYYSTDGSELLIPPLINGFPDGSRAVLLIGWQRIAASMAATDAVTASAMYCCNSSQFILQRNRSASNAGSFSLREPMRERVSGLGRLIWCLVTQGGLRRGGRLIRRGIGGGVGVGGSRLVRGEMGGVDGCTDWAHVGRWLPPRSSWDGESGKVRVHELVWNPSTG